MGFLKDKAYGEMAEHAVAEGLKVVGLAEVQFIKNNKCDLEYNIKFEVKRDGMAKKTGNVAVEFECNGKPSCLSVTEAQIWIYQIGEDFWWVPTDDLKAYLNDETIKHKIVMGGDGNRSKLLLIPFYDFISYLAKRIPIQNENTPSSSPPESMA